MATSFLGGLTGGFASGMASKKEKESKDAMNALLKRTVPAPKSATPSSESSVTEAHKGGRIPKTAVYRMKKGEVVIPADVVKNIEGRVKGSRKPVRKSVRKSSRR